MSDEYSQNRDKAHRERVASQQLESFARNIINRPMSATPLNKTPNAVQKHFQEIRPPEKARERAKLPEVVSTLPVIIVVNGEFKTALFHVSGGLTDPPVP